MKKRNPSILQMKPLALAASLGAALFLSSHSAMAQPVIANVFPNGSYQFQSTNELTFLATSSAGIANVAVTLTPTTLLGVQGFAQTLTSGSGLTVSGTANSQTVTAPLTTNVLYTVKIVVTDINSTSTTNNETFDTIFPAYTWEAVDWDYISNGVDGLFIDNPQVNQYAGRASTDGVDFHSTNPGSGNSNYRPQGLETEGAGDVPRLQYVGTTNINYDVGYNNGGNWANFTRHYPSGQYNVFIRASDGNGPQANAGDVAVVAGTASFNVPGTNYFSVKSTGWQTYGWYPMINNTSNQPAVLTIPNDGTASTLRMTIDGGNCNENYLLLMPINTNAPVPGEGFITNAFPNGAYQFQQSNSFNCSVMSPNGVQSIIANVTGNSLESGTFSQTLTGSSGLTITGVFTNEDVSFVLTTDTVYTVQFLITDGAGNLSTASLSFDTINPNYYTWEAEDYDYSSGNFFDNPQTNAYYQDAGVANVDCYNPGGAGNANAYLRAVGPIFANDHGDLNVEPNGDVPRLQYLNTTNPIFGTPYVDYDVGFTAGGQWGNYSRTYPGGTYNIYVRASSGGNGSSDSGTISLVTSGVDPQAPGNGTTSQTLSQLGSFSAVATGNWQAYQWIPVLNSGGYPARFIGSNGIPQVLRMTFVNANCNLNCYMLVPANLNNNPPPFVNGFTPDGSAIFQPSNTVTFVANSSVGITPANISLYLNGVKQSGLTISGNGFADTVSCPIQTNQLYTAIITLKDTVGTTSYTNSFATYSAGNYQFEAEDYDYSGGQFFDNTPDAYAGLGGTAGVDLLESDLNAFSRGYTYRSANGADFPDTTAGDLPRTQFSSGTDYSIGSFGPNSWANYTRHYPLGTYNVVGRFAEGAAVTHATLSVLGQVTPFAGSFTIPLGGWSSWEWATLVDNNGNPAKVTLDGTQRTLQLGGSPNGGDPEVNVNFYMLVATSPAPPINASYSAGNVHLSFVTQTGYHYQVVYKVNLTDPSWTPLGSSLAGDNAYQTVSDSTASHRFYQVQITTP
ncbi:MAG TPA: hypothetical protein VNU95_11930 [Candidatus Acidoferrales bacterium]|nr:hypothetical protein [Candidatus Acidoferrales bacterium]